MLALRAAGSHFALCGMFGWTTTVAMPACLQSDGFNVDMQPGIYGDVTLTLVADAEDEIPETNESNNELEVYLPMGSLTPMQCGNP